MRLLPDPDALEFAAGVRDLLAAGCDPDARRAAWDRADPDLRARGRVPGLWRRLADTGAAGLTVPERYGGAGMDLTAAVPVLVEAGRAAVPEPLAQTLAGVALLAAAGGPVAEAWLPRVAAGEGTLALGRGEPALVPGGQWADLLLLADADGAVHALERHAVRLEEQPTLDPGVGTAVVRWVPAAGVELPAPDGWALGFDTACVAAAAELAGLALAMLDMAVGHAKTREQFGRPIGAFQAVQHALADVHVAVAFALPVLHRGSWSLAHGLPSRARDVSHATLAASRAAERAARTALQVHAGIGYTYEHDLHMWMKRSWSLTAAWADPALHRGRVAAALLAAAPPPRVP